MPDSPRAPVRQPQDPDAALCRRLYWNGKLLQVGWDARIGDPSAEFVWCSHSMNCLGPDGRVASRRACRAGRVCWEGTS